MSLIDGDALLKRVQQEEIQAQIHGREFSTCFMSPGGTPSTEWWFVEDLIENAPTIEPERKKGKWIDDGTEFGCCCDSCGVTLDDYFMGDLSEVHLHKIPNYCPNCGADMRGEQDESD